MSSRGSWVWGSGIQTTQVCSVQFSCSVVFNSLQPHGLQHTRLPCASPTPRAYSNSCPLCWWCHPTISSSMVPFSSHLQSFTASGPFPRSQFFTSGGQSTGASASASVLPMNIQDWFPLGLTGLIYYYYYYYYHYYYSLIRNAVCLVDTVVSNSLRPSGL